MAVYHEYLVGDAAAAVVVVKPVFQPGQFLSGEQGLAGMPAGGAGPADVLEQGRQGRIGADQLPFFYFHGVEQVVEDLLQFILIGEKR